MLLAIELYRSQGDSPVLTILRTGEESLYNSGGFSSPLSWTQIVLGEPCREEVLVAE